VYALQAFELVRRSVIRGGMSIRAAAREFGIDRRTVRKMVENPAPPGYRPTRPRLKPKLGPYLAKIEQIVSEDESAPPKQRHTARRIYERVRDEAGYEGSYQQVRVYVAQLKARPKECFVPLESVPGEGEADFFEAWSIIEGRRMRVHVFVLELAFSGVWFARAYPAENAESFADGHVSSFEFFGGIPSRIVYDNPGYAVKREKGGLKGRERRLTDSFAELCSACLFEPVFAAPSSGNEKGSVERRVRTVRSGAFVPLPVAASFDELNQKLAALATSNRDRAERFEKEASQLLPLVQYKPARLAQVKVDRLALVHFDSSSYSVPFELCARSLLVRATPFRVEISNAGTTVARHARSIERGRVVTELAHYIGLLERKPRAASRAVPVVQAGLPLEFEAYRRRVADGTGMGDRQFVAVLRLATIHGPLAVAGALSAAIAKGITDPAAIGLMCMKKEELPAVCTHPLRQGLRAPSVERPPLAEYTRLLAGAR
jgi:transposase